MLNYESPAGLLEPLVPAGVELDRWRDTVYVSVVGFLFHDTRVLGLSIPGHRTFEEVNLRLYVRRDVGTETRRGVVFIRELVPSPVIALVARLWYNEPYRAVPITSEISRTSEAIVVRRAWRTAHREHHLELSASRASRVPPETSLEHHFKEHAWGFGRTRGGRLLRYRVDHPTWAIHDVQALVADVGFAATYGQEGEFLEAASPASVMLAEGSAIAVYRAATL